MLKFKTRATVGSDGMVHLDLPFGPDHVGVEVEITIKSATEADWRILSQEEYRDRILRLAGSVDDPAFERPVQGVHDDREPLE